MAEDTQEKTSGLRNLFRKLPWLVGATTTAVVLAQKDQNLGTSLMLLSGEMLVGVLASLDTHNLNFWRASHPAHTGETDLGFVAEVLKKLKRSKNLEPEPVPVQLEASVGD